MTYQLFWGETHHNSYQHGGQDPPLVDILDFASRHLDFYTGAYYMRFFEFVPPKPHLQGPALATVGGHLSEETGTAGQNYRGVHLERPKDVALMAQEWREFQIATAKWNRPGEFVAFPGYEWQGNGRWGDHNVVYQEEGHPLCDADTLPALYDFLRKLPIRAIAIPHHTGYLVGQRAPDWRHCDERLSPFAELFSIHGCSETDEEWIGLRQNAHMGPGVGGGTYQEALDRGLHLGAICSTDNWTHMPGHWGQGLMGCWASELSREGLWEAFLARRVYGVTGDRIQLEFTCNGARMGSILSHAPRRELAVTVRGSDAIDRIEILRNGRVWATYCHQGQWSEPQPGQRTRYKLRLEVGWGPRPNELPKPEHHWDGELTVGDGRMVGWEPCWISPWQGVPRLEGDTAWFHMVSRQEHVGRPMQGATLFEFEATPESLVQLRLNGLELTAPVSALSMRSHLLWYRDECIHFLRDATGLEPERAEGSDAYYHFAHKAKLHRVIPEAGYTVTFTVTDDEPLTQETHYRVRVEQRNGQRAWSSPIWVQGADEA
ncbi:MAG: hypothetical protein KatS3mg050_4019 [Litorilinea sp.]|nr:MAG: hypothetical protein KatS3mg050_4019 [Litorilinea sp.]